MSQPAYEVASAQVSIYPRIAGGFSKQLGEQIAAPLRDIEKASSQATSKLRTQLAGAFEPIKAMAGGVGRFVDGFRNASAAASVFSGRMGTLGGQVRNVFDTMTAPLLTVGYRVRTALAPLRSAIVAPFQGAVRAVGSVATKMSAQFAAPLQAVTPALTGMTNAFRSGMGAIGTITQNAMRGVVGGIQGAARAATPALVGLGAVVSTHLGSAISRADTLNNFPRIMQNLGYSAGDAADAMEKINKGIKGLPTRMDAMAGSMQKLAPIAKNLDEAADISIAMNNALLAGGKDAMTQANAFEQFTQIMARGKPDAQSWLSMFNAMPGQINQLSQALLGAGKNQADLCDALQDGTVSFDDFNAALIKLNKEGLDGFASFEQQAKDATKGIQTAFVNVGSAITRNLEQIIQALGAESIAAVGERIAKGIDTIGGKITEFVEKIKSTGLKDAFNGLAPALAAVAAVAAPVLGQFLGGLPVIGGLLGSFPGVLGALGGPLGIIASVVGTVIASTPQLRQQLGGLISSIVPPLVEMGKVLLPMIMNTARQLGAALVPVIQQILAALTPVIEMIVTRLLPIITHLIASLLPIVVQVVRAVLPVVGQIIEVVAPLIAMVVEQLMPIIEALLPVVTTVFQGIADVIESVMRIVSGIIDAVMKAIKGDWEGAWDSLVGAVRAIFDDLGPTIMRALEGIGQMMFDAGKKIIMHLVDGIKSVAGNIGEAMSGVMGKVRNFLPFSPPKEGPLAGRNWGGWGETIGGELAHGLRASTAEVGAASDRMMRAAAPNPADAAAVNRPRWAGAGAAVTGGSTINQTNTIVAQDPQLAARFLSRELRLAGV